MRTWDFEDWRLLKEWVGASDKYDNDWDSPRWTSPETSAGQGFKGVFGGGGFRSPGRVNVKAVYIHGDGNIGIQENNILKGNISDGKCTGGVRPALWLKLESH